MRIRTIALLAATLCRLSLPAAIPLAMALRTIDKKGGAKSVPKAKPVPKAKQPKVPRPVPVARHGIRPARCACVRCGVSKRSQVKRRAKRT